MSAASDAYNRAFDQAIALGISPIRAAEIGNRAADALVTIEQPKPKPKRKPPHPRTYYRIASCFLTHDNKRIQSDVPLREGVRMSPPPLLTGEECAKLEACCRRHGVSWGHREWILPPRWCTSRVHQMRKQLCKLRHIIELEHKFCGEEDW